MKVTKQSRLLIVDDDARIRSLLRTWLDAAGFEIAEACNGKEALLSVRAQAPNLVICDLFMAEMDGIETIQILRDAFPDVKVIAMSGGAFQGQVDLLPVAKVLGAIETVNKPLDMARVLASIERILALDDPA